MFSTKHSLATLYLAGPTYSNELAANLAKRGVTGATILAGGGLWQGAFEPSFRIEIIGETAAPAHNVEFGEGDIVLMPSDPNAFEGRIRTLAENLAADYRQDAVAWHITPLAVFELTTAQATYKRHG